MRIRRLMLPSAILFGVGAFSAHLYVNNTKLGSDHTAKASHVGKVEAANPPVPPDDSTNRMQAGRNFQALSEKIPPFDSETGEIVFDELEIYGILQAINLDTNGDIVIDGGLHDVLEKLFGYSGFNLDRITLHQLEEMIKRDLPGEAGEQTAHLALAYFDYRSAENSLGFFSGTQNEKHDPSIYAQKMQLRRAYLGDDVANKMFAEEEALVNYFHSAMKLVHTGGNEKSNQTDVYGIHDIDKPKSGQTSIETQLNQLQTEFNDRFAALDTPVAHTELQYRAERLRQEGVSEPEILNMLANVVGRQKAQALIDEKFSVENR
ncbi:Lipase chaperone [Thalassocella blandensis]|nr:Lipase chaperone [Thalassocella blandensis]